MWTSYPIQRNFCAVILLLGTISTLMSWKNSSHTKRNNFSIGFGENDTILNARGLTKGNVKVLRKYTNYFNIPKLNLINPKTDLKEVYILGLFELSTRLGKREEGFSEMAAAQIAVNHVNKLNILPGYLLKLITNDTQCDPGVGIDRFFHALYSSNVILMVLGAGCSNVSESLANVVPYWNILQVSFGSTSPVLSDRTKFPLFFRTVAPDSSHNAAKISFIKYFGWSTVATLTWSQEPYLLSLDDFVNELEAINVTCIATITFSLDNFKEQLKILKEVDTRIIIGSFSAEMASKIFCEVFKLEMYGEDYMWILQEQNENWWKISYDCPLENLKKVVDGLILVSDYNSLSPNETSISKLTNKAFESELLNDNVTLSNYAPQTYDAIWAMALTMRNTLSLCKYANFLRRFNYKDSTMVQQFILEMEALNFIGISGPVKFNGADRVGNSIFKQINGGSLCEIAIYYAGSNFLDFNCRGCSEIKWQGGHVPIAQRILKFRLVTIPKLAFYLVLFSSTIGILISILCLYFNLHFRRVRTVKLSSPRLNNIVVLGCILVYLAVILLGLDQATIFFDEDFLQLCTIRVYLLAAGFSLTFGSIFAKTYRVHRIFTYSRTSLIKDKLLKDKQLIGLIFLLLLIDGLIILLWRIIDPMMITLRNLPIEIGVDDRDRGIIYQPQVEVCRSANTTGWFIAINSYKGCLLIVGVYMAWETRHVKIPSLNDSEYIGICVYSVVSSAIVVVLSNILADYTTLSYLATALSILISTTITLVLLFLPKLRAVLGRVDSEDTVMQSMGLKIECNTRRLIFDDRYQELLYRMEVQNRVYKSELEALDEQIIRLEALLESQLQQTNAMVVKPFTISNGLIFLSVPSTISSSRASWPLAAKNTNCTPGNFASENKLHSSQGKYDLEKIN